MLDKSLCEITKCCADRGVFWKKFWELSQMFSTTYTHGILHPPPLNSLSK